jgi:hypothetical protein
MLILPLKNGHYTIKSYRDGQALSFDQSKETIFYCQFYEEDDSDSS